MPKINRSIAIGAIDIKKTIQITKNSRNTNASKDPKAGGLS